MARADELVLQDGKTLKGTITKEDAHEFTILLGSNMVLRVAKDKVTKAVRTPAAPASSRHVVHMPVASTSTVKSSSAPVEKKEEPVARKPGVSVERTIVSGPTGWETSWEGAADKEGDQFKWKWAVIRATITEGASPSLGKGRVGIYTDASQSFADQLAVLRAPSEKMLRDDSTRLFDEMKEKAAKKIKGFERREKKSVDQPKK